MKLRSFRVVLLLAAVVATAACSTFARPLRIDVPAPQEPVSVAQLVAGASRVDITPPPGISTGGHSVSARTARGFWTRLFVRTFYLQDQRGHRLVIAVSELPFMPAGLGDRVAEIIGAEPGPAIGRGDFIFAATHTHHGPGNFATASVYNHLASRWAGFDERLFEFLANRIAVSVLEARQNALSTAAQLEVGFRDVYSVARNRSLDAFLLNRDSAEILAENSNAPIGPTNDLYPSVDAYRAVAPRLSVLKFWDVGSDRLIGALGFYAVHPTVLPADLDLYHGDLFGAAATLAEQSLGDAGHAPVVAFVNGPEGDLSPIWDRRDRREALHLGRRLAGALESVLGGGAGTVLAPELRSRFVRASIRGVCVPATSAWSFPALEPCTPDEPAAGTALVGGAEDGRSPLYELGFKEGVKRAGRLDKDNKLRQGSKHPPFEATLPLPWPLSGDLTKLLLGKTDVPSDVPLGVHRIGDLTLVTLPGEFTMTMGRRILKTVAAAVEVDDSLVVPVGLANEYISYVATPEEYEAQHYEGASTLWGPAVGPVLSARLAMLAQSASSSAKPGKRTYKPGKREEFRFERIGDSASLPDDGLGGIVNDLATGRPVRDYPRACWIDTVRDLPDANRLNISTVMDLRINPYVKIQSRTGIDGPWTDFRHHGVLEDNFGLRLVTVAASLRPHVASVNRYVPAARDDRNRAVWCAIWMPPPGVKWMANDFADRHRFVVETVAGGERTCAARRDGSFGAGLCGP